jgi:hypothetical protein
VVVAVVSSPVEVDDEDVLRLGKLCTQQRQHTTTSNLQQQQQQRIS